MQALIVFGGSPVEVIKLFVLVFSSLVSFAFTYINLIEWVDRL
jgi:hypothetical protein